LKGTSYVKLEPKLGKLPNDNRATLDKHLAQFGKDQKYSALLQLFADVCDLAAEGADCYVTFGAARDKQSLLMTVHQDGAKAYLGAVSLVGLADEAQKVL
jgi:hypothetical protein